MMNELKLTLPGSIRSKKNSKRIFARGKFKTVLPSKAYEIWEKSVRGSMIGRPLIQECGTPRIILPLLDPITINAQIYFAGQRPDLSGCLESIGDCLEGIIWENDKQIISWDGSRLHHDLKNPRTELIITFE
jgi:Holliday junction resolvase RusA-like endonuclease